MRERQMRPALARTRASRVTSTLARLRQETAWLLFGIVVLAAVLVALFGTGDQTQLLFSTCLFAVLAYAWNIISGLSGYVSFGQVGFFGIGAYVAATCQILWQWDWYLAALGAVLAAIVLALPLGTVMLRLQGIFFALGMFGLSRIGALIATSTSLVGGSMGEPVPMVGTTQETALVMLGCAVGAVVLTAWLLRSPLGLRLLALRDDEKAAEASGINTNASKVIAFCLSAALAALAGSLYVWNVGFIDPGSAFNNTYELQTILMVLFGGIGTLWGPLLGAVVISLISNALWAQFPQQQQIILGALILIAVIWMPGGLVSLFQRFGWLRRRPVWGPPPPIGTEKRLPLFPVAVGNTDESVLCCQEVTRRFGGLTALNRVSLEARSGRIVAVIGPNGAGKTTLFNLITGFDRCNGGAIRLGERLLNRLAPYRIARAGIARTFQTCRPFPSLTAWETLLLPALVASASKEEAIRAAAQMLERLALRDQWDASPESLPPGQLRFLEIGRALMLRPRVLLLDEVMAGMSPEEIRLIHTLLREAVAAGCAVVAIEHVVPAIMPIADHVYVLDFGTTIAQGRPDEVLRNPAVIEAYLGTGEEEPVNA
ncbi:branched-chain amino acid ABC transporter ATP-binding protein/permease [Thermogemmatispora sp.]|uniref:branched-chain amino acid ABC transporter ATP-binding protein/permease n=1 Tax=Thermogemmatispora sp. TaxID=1968838 RepID=UPI001D48EC4E|nr:branched-chain amino acid ABC transporter ATP-binding protein/permease [Thermogemmatispora sp.]MBX5449075.1 branched-chain amino acid ABC transporter ATP-binding protein/permease [Thermogemmatispora sp.]